MRTTVELPDPLYRRVRALASARGARGFSPIIEEAVREYLERGGRDETADDAFLAARGAWGIDDADRFEAELKDAWATWPTPRS
ncbi:MAG TPA: ribbon-helix-helix protein, CopG family [Conexibacter sp.]|nr:ribbon-helix-helix protein, CopG family [Conexibacter sp.]